MLSRFRCGATGGSCGDWARYRGGWLSRPSLSSKARLACACGDLSPQNKAPFVTTEVFFFGTSVGFTLLYLRPQKLHLTFRFLGCRSSANENQSGPLSCRFLRLHHRG